MEKRSEGKGLFRVLWIIYSYVLVWGNVKSNQLKFIPHSNTIWHSLVALEFNELVNICRHLFSLPSPSSFRSNPSRPFLPNKVEILMRNVRHSKRSLMPPPLEGHAPTSW